MRIAIWLIIGAFLVNMVFASVPVFAWDDPDPDDVLTCSLVRGEYSKDGVFSWVGGTWLGSRWPDQVAGRSPTKFDAPPQLDATEAFRWRQASPAARPYLARIYGISPEIAKIYWANYKIP